MHQMRTIILAADMGRRIEGGRNNRQAIILSQSCRRFRTA
jgi:hypothetical protein